MITLVLQRLDDLHRDLARIDPAHDLDAADRVAELAKALRETFREAAPRPVSKSSQDQCAAA